MLLFWTCKQGRLLVVYAAIYFLTKEIRKFWVKKVIVSKYNKIFLKTIKSNFVFFKISALYKNPSLRRLNKALFFPIKRLNFIFIKIISVQVQNNKIELCVFQNSLAHKKSAHVKAPS